MCFPDLSFKENYWIKICLYLRNKWIQPIKTSSCIKRFPFVVVVAASGTTSFCHNRANTSLRVWKNLWKGTLCLFLNFPKQIRLCTNQKRSLLRPCFICAERRCESSLLIPHIFPSERFVSCGSFETNVAKWRVLLLPLWHTLHFNCQIKRIHSWGKKKLLRSTFRANLRKCAETESKEKVQDFSGSHRIYRHQYRLNVCELFTAHTWKEWSSSVRKTYLWRMVMPSVSEKQTD